MEQIIESKNFNDVKFGLIKYQPGWYWSKVRHKFFYSDNIENIIWEAEDLPVRTEQLSLSEILKYVQEHPGQEKSQRNAIMRFTTDRFPIKDIIGLEKWNCTIYADLDLKNSPLIVRLDDEQQALLYDQLDYALQCICPNNYAYIEHSSSRIGIHCLFYFACVPNEVNHDKYAQYVYDIFRYKIDEYIKDFSHIFDPTVIGSTHKVMDDVYKRPYQKLYLTGFDYRIYNCDGRCDDIQVTSDEAAAPNGSDDSLTENTRFDVRYVTQKKKYDTDYYDRLYIITALKRYVGDYVRCCELWYRFCEDITLYKNYTTRDFKNMLEMNWQKIDASTGHIAVLKKYGFKVDDSNLHIYLSDDEYISNYVDEILNFSTTGINLLISGTGTGKTEVWKEWWRRVSNPIELPNHKSILIVEPMNSIINSKYNNDTEDDFVIVTGKRNLKTDIIAKCFITNYNHIVKSTYDGIVLRDDIEEFFKQFELIIIDESHIMLKDMFRSDVLIPFMQTLNKIKDTKIIIQTATPMFEESLLNVKKKITIHKNLQKTVKVIYRQVEDAVFNIAQVACLVDYYVKNGRKTYIYWKDGSLNNMRWLQNIYPEMVICYHKRDVGSEAMSYIDENHILTSNVLISSVYFGVGNDLNNVEDDVAVVVIGNNIWQEDIQAEGRWRRAKNIEICIVLKPNERQIVDTSLSYKRSFSDIYRQELRLYSQLYDDAYNRDKSVIIDGKTFMIKDKSYIEYLAKMSAANKYSQQLCVKNEEFMQRGYDVRQAIKPLLTNDQWLSDLKKYKKDINDVRNKIYAAAIHGTYDWELANKDNKTEQCVKIIKKLNDKNLLQFCDIDRLNSSKIIRYNTFLQYYNANMLEHSDWAELFSLLWTREKLATDNHREFNVMHETLKYNEYFKLCGYLIWLTYRNKEDNQHLISCNYYINFCKKVDDIRYMEDRLINRIFVANAYSEEYNKFINDFLGFELDNKIVNQENILDEICRIDVDEAYIRRAVSRICEYYNDIHVRGKKAGKKGGKKGGKKSSPKKKVRVTDKFKSHKKYNLEVGQTFDSCTELATHTGKSNTSVSQWMKKRWIEIVAKS